MLAVKIQTLHLFIINSIPVIRIVFPPSEIFIWKSNYIRKTIGSHALRRTYASFLLNQGIGIDKISKLLGHASIRTTLTYKEEEWSDYLGLTLEEAVAIANAFGKFADANGVVEIREDFQKLWENWRLSGILPATNNRILWHPEYLAILRSQIELIHGFYQQIDPDYIPPWVESSSLSTNLWNSYSLGPLD